MLERVCEEVLTEKPNDLEGFVAQFFTQPDLGQIISKRNQANSSK
jgi:hypothetical protein